MKLNFGLVKSKGIFNIILKKVKMDFLIPNRKMFLKNK